MITERDQYIASVLRECTGDKIVGVFGGAHIEGIKKHLYDVVKDENEFRRKLEAVPDHTIYSSYVSWFSFLDPPPDPTFQEPESPLLVPYY